MLYMYVCICAHMHMYIVDIQQQQTRLFSHGRAPVTEKRHLVKLEASCVNHEKDRQESGDTLTQSKSWDKTKQTSKSASTRCLVLQYYIRRRAVWYHHQKYFSLSLFSILSLAFSLAGLLLPVSRLTEKEGKKDTTPLLSYFNYHPVPLHAAVLLKPAASLSLPHPLYLLEYNFFPSASLQQTSFPVFSNSGVILSCALIPYPSCSPQLQPTPVSIPLLLPLHFFNSVYNQRALQQITLLLSFSSLNILANMQFCIDT